jgi:hypothetical protein
MIPADCIPIEGGVVIEILNTPQPNPNKFGEWTFFEYWISPRAYCGVCGRCKTLNCGHDDKDLHGQIFLKRFEDFSEQQRNARVVDRRYRSKPVSPGFQGSTGVLEHGRERKYKPCRSFATGTHQFRGDGRCICGETPESAKLETEAT